MNKLAVILLFLLSAFIVTAQDTSGRKINVGVEQDLLPYVTGGYFAGIWAGKDHVRVRALMARVYKPDFILKDGLTNNNVTAFAITTDYFLKQDWKGWWIAAGVVYWKSTIQATGKTSRAGFENLLLNGSIGYNITLYKHLYMSPWAGLNLRAAGDKNIRVDNKTFTPPLLNPEASLKFGIYL